MKQLTNILSAILVIIILHSCDLPGVNNSSKVVRWRAKHDLSNSVEIVFLIPGYKLGDTVRMPNGIDVILVDSLPIN